MKDLSKKEKNDKIKKEFFKDKKVSSSDEFKKKKRKTIDKDKGLKEYFLNLDNDANGQNDDFD